MNGIENLSVREASARLEAKKRWAFAKTEIEPVIADASKDPEAISLLPNHEFLIRSYARAQLIAKCRKTAHSWGIAACALAQCVTTAYSQEYISSVDEKEALNKLEYLTWIYEAICRNHPGFDREFRMSKGTEKKRFANGSIIHFLPRVAPTGPSGGYYGDEFSVEPRGKTPAVEILTGAIGAITHRGSIRLGGTQRGEETLFYKLWSGEYDAELRQNPDLARLLAGIQWEIGSFPWWESPALSLDPIEAARTAPQLETHQRVEKFGNAKLLTQYALYLSTPGLGLPLFQREFELKCVPDDERYYPLDLIQRCYPERDALYPFWHETLDGSNYNQDPGCIKPAFDLIDKIAATIKNGGLRGDWGYGSDIARHTDKDAIAIGHNLPEDRHSLCLRGALVMSNLPFPGKRAVWEYLITRLPITRGAVDATRGSVGVQLAEELELRYNQRAQGVQYNSGNKQIWASGLKARMEANRMQLPFATAPTEPVHIGEFRTLQSELLQVKKIERAGGLMQFDVERTKDGHGDMFWATASWNGLYDQAPDGGSQSIIVVGRDGNRIGAGHRPAYGSQVYAPAGYGRAKRRVIS